jgi:two-component system chemotaxis sensor kinase CheA
MRFNKDVLVNGTNPLRLLDELRELGPCRVMPDASAVPSLQELEADLCSVSWTVELETNRPRASILDVFIFVIDEMDLTLDCEASDGSASEAEAVASPVLAAAAAPALGAEPPAAPHVRDESPAPTARPEAEAGRTSVGKEMSTLRVAAERLDELMDRVGELVIAQARLSQLAGTNPDPNVKVVAEEIQRLVSGLRDTTMGIRMVPVGQLFGRFRRLIHDLSHDLGKPVDLSTSGEETELDKTMIDRLVDPLVHIIRNAIDHGLETPAARAEAGKAPAGRIELRAVHSGAEVRITVKDDGRGLDAVRIRAKAEEQGLLAPGAAIAEADLFQFLFHPGFSTAREISALSGRGVGMDVVKRTIEGLRGTIDLATSPGRGTEVTLRLPLTLAIIEGLLVRVGEGMYVVPLASVEECVELSAADDARSSRRSLFNLRGAHLPFVRLRELFDAATPADPHQKIVIVASGETRIGLVVDQIIGNHQTVIKSLSKLQADVQSFSGATILGDGSVALIFDVPQLIAAGQNREQHRQQNRREAA